MARRRGNPKEDVKVTSKKKKKGFTPIKEQKFKKARFKKMTKWEKQEEIENKEKENQEKKEWANNNEKLLSMISNRPAPKLENITLLIPKERKRAFKK